MTPPTPETPDAPANAEGVFICPPDHKHGATTTCYSEHLCRCRRCRDRRTLEWHRGETRRVTGTQQEYVPALPVAAHIIFLMREGWRYDDIELVSGVTKPTIGRIKRGITKRVTRETADAIIGTRPDMRSKAPADVTVDGTGTIRRIRALAAVGWNFHLQSAHLGFTFGYVGNLTKQSIVTARTATNVRNMYDELWDQPPPQQTKAERDIFNRTRKHARRAGWPGPLDWDDETIDDADAEPDIPEDRFEVDEAVVDSALRGEKVTLTAAEKRLAVKIAHMGRWSDGLTAARLRVSDRTVLRIRQELDLDAWPVQILVNRTGRAA